MGLAVVTITLAQLLDLSTFLRMVSVHGAEAEANPIVRGLIDELGIPFVAVAKIAALAVVVAVVVLIGDGSARRSRPRLAAMVVAVAIVAGIVGGWSNALVLRSGLL